MDDLLSYSLQQRLQEETQWDKIDAIIDWKPIVDLVETGLRKHRKSNAGRKGFDTLKHIKALLLGQWHSLSDPGLEQALKIRLDFIKFCDFGINETPDETTLCKFRNKLITKQLLEPLLEEINRQLEEKELKVKEADAAVIDATIISSAARPNKQVTYDKIPEDRNEDTDEQEMNKEVSFSKDSDARWLKKGRKSHLGYKGFARVDKDDGYVEKIIVTPANESEGKELEGLIEGCESGQRVLADKAYSSKFNRELLKEKGLKIGLMRKAARNRPLRSSERKFNKLISQERWIVEQCFGTLKRKFKMGRASYFSTEKVKGELLLKSICYNLLKASNKVILAS